ncbi:MAG: 1-phosphofructokinase [Candidatus Melainabacteria bacterium GWF2_32_7]|nr:MAG: 1-phosphofructokinase [Candidatus Melainabacteria bacterium GWF2_32_7]
MILSVTLNPSLDYVLQVNNLALEETQRSQGASFYASGKGINVSRMLARFSVQTSSWGFVGGLNGDRLLRILEDEGIDSRFIPCNDETRINVIVTELPTYKQLRISAKGPNISGEELDKLYKRIKNLPEEIEFVTFGGSLPQGVSSDIYKNLIEIILSKNVKCVLDTSNEPLTLGIQAKPYLIKPNLHELCQIIGTEKLRDLEEIKVAAAQIVKSGVKNVVVSLAKDGAIFVNENKIIHALAPNVEVKSKVGAGDSMVAGLIYAMHRNMSEEDTIIYGIAFGTAAVLTPGTELAYKSDVEKLRGNIEIASIEENNYV